MDTSQPPSSCDLCGRSFSRDDNLQNHMRNCTGHSVAVAAAITVPAPAVEPRLKFKWQKTGEALEGNVKQLTVNMKEVKRL